MIKVTVECPICHDSMDVKVKIIEEEEGDPTIPYGTHTYLTVDDYRLPKQSHQDCVVMLEAEDIVTKWPATSKLEVLLRKAEEEAIPIFETRYERPTDD